MDVAQRVAGARLQPTFLMADVEIVATYKHYNISRTKLENLIHRIFDPARMDIQIKDRFGHPVIPREWFLVPLFAIDEAVDRIKDGTITGYSYDPKTASLRHGYEGNGQIAADRLSEFATAVPTRFGRWLWRRIRQTNTLLGMP